MASKSKNQGIYEFTRIALGQKTYGKRQFKRDLRKLQRSGLLNPKIDINLQAPTKYMLSRLRKFAAVVKGEAKTIEINPGERKYYKSSGYKTKNGRAVIPTPNGESVKRIRAKNGIPQFQTTPKRGTSGMRRTETLIPHSDLESYVVNVISSAPDLPRGQYYGFRYFGNNSIVFYSGDDYGKRAMMERILNYSSMEDAVANGNAEVEDEIYQNFALIKIINQSGKDAWEAGVQAQRQRAREAYREANRDRRIESRRRYHASLSEEQILNRKIYRLENAPENAVREKARRARIARSNPEKYLANKEAARKRAAKSRANKKR